MSKNNLIAIRLDDDLLNAVKARASLEHGTVTDLVKRAIISYMNADMNIQNEILGYLEQVNKSVKTNNQNYAVFYSLFFEYLTYFFAFNISEFEKWSSSDNDKEKTIAIRKKQIEKGERFRNDFKDRFTHNSRNLRRVIENLFADCLVEDVEERDSEN